MKIEKNHAGYYEGTQSEGSFPENKVTPGSQGRIVVLSAWLLIGYAAMWVMSFAFHHIWLPAFGLVVEILVTFFLSALASRNKISLETAGHVITGLLLGGIYMSNYYTGGPSGSNVVAFLLVPVIAIVTTEGKGWWWLLPTLALSAGMSVAQHEGFDFPNLIPEDYRYIDEAITWITVMVVLAGVVFAYERIRKERERQLDRQKQLAEQAASARSRFLASLSHEFRTPLHIIVGNCDLLEQQCSSKKEKQRVEEMRQSAHNLLAMVEDAMDVAHLDSDSFEIHPGPFRPDKVIRDILYGLQKRTEKSGLEVIFLDSRKNRWEVRGDPLRFRQIFLNLVDNALKYAAPGKLEIELSDDPTGLLLLDVKDDGPGIDPEYRESIFEEFFRVPSSSKSRYRGAGLGLSIGRRFARAMGGDLELLPSERGCHFRLCLPFPEWQTFRPSALVHPILVVEDDEINRSFLKTALERQGLVAHVASNGLQAVSMLENRPYALMFIDLQLPDISGIEVAKKVKEMQLQQKPVMVALTAHALPEHRNACIAAGMDDFVAKPITVDGLVEVVRRWIPAALDQQAVQKESGYA